MYVYDVVVNVVDGGCVVVDVLCCCCVGVDYNVNNIGTDVDDHVVDYVVI